MTGHMCTRSFFAPEEYFEYSFGAQRPYHIYGIANVRESKEACVRSMDKQVKYDNGSKEVIDMMNSPS